MTPTPDRSQSADCHWSESEGGHQSTCEAYSVLCTRGKFGRLRYVAVFCALAPTSLLLAQSNLFVFDRTGSKVTVLDSSSTKNALERLFVQETISRPAATCLLLRLASQSKQLQWSLLLLLPTIVVTRIAITISQRRQQLTYKSNQLDLLI